MTRGELRREPAAVQSIDRLLLGAHAQGAAQVVAALQKHAAQRTRQILVQEIRGSGLRHGRFRVEAADQPVGDLDGVVIPDVFDAAEELLGEFFLQLRRARGVEAGQQGIDFRIGVLPWR